MSAAKERRYRLTFTVAHREVGSLHWVSFFAPYDERTRARRVVEASTLDQLDRLIRWEAPSAFVQLERDVIEGGLFEVPKDSILGLSVSVRHDSTKRKPNGFDLRFGSRSGLILARGRDFGDGSELVG